MSKTINVWLVEANIVYKDVPFTVVSDWIQQSRVLEDDRVMFKGTKEWVRVGDSPEFSVYLPRAPEFSAEDEAEALEPVELEVHWKRPHYEEDDDIEMIPLIDVSLVLLIFFVLSAPPTTGAMGGNIPTQEIKNGTPNQNRELIWIGVEFQGENTEGVVYSIGRANKPATKSNMNQADALVALDQELPTDGSQREVCLRVNKKIPHGEIVSLTLELEARRSKISRQWTEGTEIRQ